MSMVLRVKKQTQASRPGLTVCISQFTKSSQKQLTNIKLQRKRAFMVLRSAILEVIKLFREKYYAGIKDAPELHVKLTGSWETLVGQQDTFGMSYGDVLFPSS